MQTSFERQITLTSIYFLPKIWYLLNFLTPPKHIILSAENLIDRYLWFPAKKNIIKKETLKLPKEEGGLLYPQLYLKMQTTRLIKHIRRYQLNIEANWTGLYDYYFDLVQGSSRKNINNFKVPEYFKQFRLAITDCKVKFDGETLEIFSKPFNPRTISTKSLYHWIAHNKFKNKW